MSALLVIANSKLIVCNTLYLNGEDPSSKGTDICVSVFLHRDRYVVTVAKVTIKVSAESSRTIGRVTVFIQWNFQIHVYSKHQRDSA